MENQSDLSNEKTLNDEYELNKQTSEVDTIEVDLKRVEDTFKYLVELKSDSGINTNEKVIEGSCLFLTLIYLI